MASQELQGFSKEMKEYLWQLSREKYQLDRQDDLVMAKRAGRKEVIELLKSGKSPEAIINEFEV